MGVIVLTRRRFSAQRRYVCFASVRLGERTYVRRSAARAHRCAAFTCARPHLPLSPLLLMLTLLAAAALKVRDDSKRETAMSCLEVRAAMECAAARPPRLPPVAKQSAIAPPEVEHPERNERRLFRRRRVMDGESIFKIKTGQPSAAHDGVSAFRALGSPNDRCFGGHCSQGDRRPHNEISSARRGGRANQSCRSLGG